MIWLGQFVVGRKVHQVVVERLEFFLDAVDFSVRQPQLHCLVFAHIEAAIALLDADGVRHVGAEDPVRVVAHDHIVGVHGPDRWCPP